MLGADYVCKKMGSSKRVERGMDWITRHPAEFYMPLLGATAAATLNYIGVNPIKGLFATGVLYGIIKTSQHLHDLDGKKNPVYRLLKHVENKRGERKVTEYFNMYDDRV